MNREFLCDECKFVLKVSRDNVKKSQNMVVFFAPNVVKQ